MREWRDEAGLPVQSKPTASELEMAWVFHSGIFYYGVRKYIYESPVLEDKEQMIGDTLDVFLAGIERVFTVSALPMPAPMKAVGQRVYIISKPPPPLSHRRIPPP